MSSTIFVRLIDNHQASPHPYMTGTLHFGVNLDVHFYKAVKYYSKSITIAELRYAKGTRLHYFAAPCGL